MFSVLPGEKSEWLGLRRRSGGMKQHYGCCFGINHWPWTETHQLCMLEVVTDEENDPLEEGSEAAGRNEVQNLGSSKGKQTLRKGGTIYYDRKQ